MTTSHFTPGPWRWFNDGDLANAEGHMILRPDANRGIPTDADAALIAAAPELYAALKHVLWNDRITSDEWLLKTRAAIEKAEGKP